MNKVEGELQQATFSISSISLALNNQLWGIIHYLKRNLRSGNDWDYHNSRKSRALFCCVFSYT